MQISGKWLPNSDAAGPIAYAKQILLATGIGRHGPLAWYRRRIVPIGSFSIVTDPMDPEILRQLMPQASLLRHQPDYRQLFPRH
ncbi:hypothetical protein P4S72_27605 [Vibrio sp. PP-XX7]